MCWLVKTWFYFCFCTHALIGLVIAPMTAYSQLGGSTGAFVASHQRCCCHGETPLLLTLRTWRVSANPITEVPLKWTNERATWHEYFSSLIGPLVPGTGSARVCFREEGLLTCSGELPRGRRWVVLRKFGFLNRKSTVFFLFVKWLVLGGSRLCNCLCLLVEWLDFWEVSLQTNGTLH